MKDPFPSIPLAECHCLNLWRAAMRAVECYNLRMEDTGVSVQQFSLLRHLHALAPITITDLAQAMWLDRSTLSRNLKLLEEQGLVTNIATAGRAKQITLTEEGRKVFLQAETCWNQAQQAFEERLGPEHLAQWREILALLLKGG